MPSHADRVRRHYAEAAPQADPAANPHDAALRGAIAEVERYAGWLAKDHGSTAVKAGVRALDVAVQTGTEISAVLETLDQDIARLPSGSVRKMMREHMVKVHASVEQRRIAQEREAS